MDGAISLIMSFKKKKSLQENLLVLERSAPAMGDISD